MLNLPDPPAAVYQTVKESQMLRSPYAQKFRGMKGIDLIQKVQLEQRISEEKCVLFLK